MCRDFSVVFIGRHIINIMMSCSNTYVNVTSWRSKLYLTILVIGLAFITSFLFIGYGNGSLTVNDFIVKSPSSSELSTAHTAEEKPPTSSCSSSASSMDKNRRLLLLVTKPRSGSSYTSPLIANHSSVFYTFEPLSKEIYPSNHFFTRSTRNRIQMHKIISSYFNCDFTNLSSSYLNMKALTRTEYGRDFHICEDGYQKGYAHINCYNTFVRTCREKTTVFLKVTRIPLSWTEKILREFPNLKILYLLRDPRAEIYSRSFGQNGIKWADLKQSIAQQHCLDISEDIENVHKYKTLFPGRVKLIRYESAVFDPAAYAEDIYQFIDLQFSEKTKQYIQSLQKPARRRVDIRNDNATESLYKWRTQPESFKAGSLIDRFCGDLYDRVGYSKIPSKNIMKEHHNPFCAKYEEFSKISKYLGA